VLWHTQERSLKQEVAAVFFTLPLCVHPTVENATLSLSPFLCYRSDSSLDYVSRHSSPVLNVEPPYDSPILEKDGKKEEEKKGRDDEL
jgi:hypothetical protein